MAPIVREFFRLVYSKEGQEAVVKAGYFTLPAVEALRELKKLD